MFCFVICSSQVFLISCSPKIYRKPPTVWHTQHGLLKWSPDSWNQLCRAWSVVLLRCGADNNIPFRVQRHKHTYLPCAHSKLPSPVSKSHACICTSLIFDNSLHYFQLFLAVFVINAHIIGARKQLVKCGALQRPDNLFCWKGFVNIVQLLTVHVISCLKEFYLKTPPVGWWHFTDSSTSFLREKSPSVRAYRGSLLNAQKVFCGAPGKIRQVKMTSFSRINRLLDL